MKNKKRRKLGFTLIEMLVTVAIIALLMSVGLTVYARAQRKARDGRRQADLEQIRSSLETYRTNEGDGYYPLNLTRLTTEGYLDPLPVDPGDGSSYENGYTGNNCTGSDCTGYTLVGNNFETIIYTATEKGVAVTPIP